MGSRQGRHTRRPQALRESALPRASRESRSAFRGLDREAFTWPNRRHAADDETVSRAGQESGLTALSAASGLACNALLRCTTHRAAGRFLLARDASWHLGIMGKSKPEPDLAVKPRSNN